MRTLLIDSGLWCSLRSRPYGKIPAINDAPAALFVTAIDTSPLGPDMEGIIALAEADFLSGLKALTICVDAPLYLCQDAGQKIVKVEIPGVEQVAFAGPHPAGLPSTHIHFLDPVHENKTAWHIGAQDVIAIGALLRTGTLQTERIVSLAGPGITEPRHIRTRLGASISELCDKELFSYKIR